MDLGLGSGDFVAGRGSDCDLVLDDSLVSRRHAAFRARADAVEVEDLGSRNGLFVNDLRIDGRSQLHHGDRVRIGSQELIVRDTELARAQPGTSELVRCGACGEYQPADSARCRGCSAAMTHTLADAAAPHTVTVPGTKRQGAFSVLAPLADKAFGMGRFDEAERLLSGPLHSVMQEVQARGAATDDDRELLALSTGYAVRLADVLQEATWLDFAFELYDAADLVMPAALIDDLYRVAASIRYAHPRPLRSYVAKLKADTARLGPSERFLLQRLEGLERRVGSA
jgi:FHA domain